MYDNVSFRPPTLKELQQTKKNIRNVNIAYRERLNSLERLATWATEKVGSVGFFIIIFLWTAFWLLWNTIGPMETRFDPYPAFVLWLFISNMIQLFLLPLLLIGQNLQSRHAETRAEIDFEINLKSEKEIEAVLLHLEHQHEMLMKLMQNFEKPAKKNKKS